MEFSQFGEIDTSDCIDTQLHIKQESPNEFPDNSNIEPVPSDMASNSSFQRIKNELVIEEEIIERPLKRRRKNQRTTKHGNTNALRSGKIENGKNGRPEWTQLPCIVNIKSSAALEIPNEEHHNGKLDASNGIPNISLQSSIPERIYDSNDFAAFNEAVEQNSPNDFTAKIYEMLVDIQSTLKDLKAEVADNSKRIDQLQKVLPQPWSSIKNDFNFPVATEEQFQELEKQLENKEMATKLVVYLTSRTFTSWREMILYCLKHMISRNVAVLYNLNGIKGTKKKFRDLNICNILVECVHYKFKEATTLEILKRISLILAGAGDWQGSRHKKE